MHAIAGEVGHPVPKFRKEVFTPSESQKFHAGLRHQVWLYRYSTRALNGNGEWELCIATLGEPGSRKLSLGGFRIEPQKRAEQPGFDASSEAVGLACGMEEKVFWSRLIQVAGPRGIKNLQRVVGGKCVLLPNGESRIGEKYDRAILDFAIACMEDFEQSSGVSLTTGQDLGHGRMSDGNTESLQYLHQRFPGSILSDTSKPTGEGNFYMLRGMLLGCGVALRDARVGLIGCGHVGQHVLDRLLAEGAKVSVVEAQESIREVIRSRGITVLTPDEKEQLVHSPIDALVVNGYYGSLDSQTVRSLAANEALRVVCGSENLAMPIPSDAKILSAARKLYCPTELCGMMGYLTAVEEYLAKRNGEAFSVECMFEAAKKLERAGERAARYVVANSYSVSFEEAIRKVYGPEAP